MKFSHFISLSVLVLGVFLMKETRRSRVKRQTFNGISFNPTAIFIVQTQPRHGISRHFQHHRED
jgi:hypothetical protein